ncbi:hypothetical protein PoB_000123000 [Plakobranchus ocellatus]|uniref:Secreted protein n=1 Tax=Plakobranchus ocellatus TaxID=259542 RepID=A0AAV3XWD3_9GAST|nr:hypothetical protein PoB_000123000 [Plakobranchus ocellatus]
MLEPGLLVYCMARRRNFLIILAAVVMAIRSPRQRISFAGVSGHPLGRSSAISRHLTKHAELSLPAPHKDDTGELWTNLVMLGLPGGACVLLLCERFVQPHSLADLVSNLLPCRCHRNGDDAHH